MFNQLEHGRAKRILLLNRTTFSRCGFLCALVCLILAAGCSSRPPISTTLTDLIAESNSYTPDLLVDFHENVSINGLLLQPQVGAHWYTAGPPWWDVFHRRRSSPAFGIGISVKRDEPTFCLYGETGAVDINAVNAVKVAIETVQAKTLEAINVTIDLSVARVALEQSNRKSILGIVPASTGANSLETRIAELEQKKATVDTALATSLEAYRTTVSTHSNVIVARWTVKKSSSGSVATGIFDVGGSRSETVSGYVVLGGVRVSSLYFGNDLRDYLMIIDESDRKLFDNLDITTYLIQTKNLAYTNALNLEEALSGTLNVRVSSLGKIKDLITDIDKITISGYIATAMNLDNTGSLTGLTWKYRKRPMVTYTRPTPDEVEQIKRQYNDAPMHTEWIRVQPAGTFQFVDSSDPTTLDDGTWCNVVAVSARAPKLMQYFRKEFTKRGSPRVAFVGERTYLTLDPGVTRNIP